MKDLMSNGKHMKHQEDITNIAAEARDTCRNYKKSRTGENEESRLQERKKDMAS